MIGIKLGNQAVEVMVNFINEAVKSYNVKYGNVTHIKESMLTGFEGRVFFYEKPPKISGEYIIVNHLPFVHRKDVGEGTVNVNIHVPRLPTGEPDSRRLSVLSQELISLFDPRGSYMSGACFKFYADSRPIEEKDGTYFINLQFTVTFNNLDYKQIWQKQQQT